MKISINLLIEVFKRCLAQLQLDQFGQTECTVRFYVKIYHQLMKIIVTPTARCNIPVAQCSDFVVAIVSDIILCFKENHVTRGKFGS